MITSHEHSRVSSYRERPPVGYEEGLGRTPQKNFGVPRGVKKPQWVGSEVRRSDAGELVQYIY